MLNDNTKLIRVQDLAKYFGVRPYTIRYWIKKYQIPVIKIGKYIYLRPESVNAFLEKRACRKSKAATG